VNTRLRTLAAPAVLLTAAALLLAGCQSGSNAAKGAAQPSAAPSRAAGQDGFGGGGPGGGGVSGQIAAINGTIAQVRGQDGQTSVSWSDSTTFERTAAATVADLKVGDCVNASSFDFSAAQGGAAPTQPAADAPVKTVAITAPGSDGTCTGGFGGGFGRGGGFNGPRPSGAPTGQAGQGENGRRSGQRPSGAPTGGPGGFGGFGAFTSGKVTAIDGSTITVDAIQISRGAGASPTPTTAPKQITVDSSTTYTATTASTAQAMQVGLCAVARGKADDSGAVAATAITVSDPVNGACGTGFGGFRGPRGGQGGGNQGGGQSTQGGTNA
jgi:hypothetical protein